jgi:hypothetical protein
MESKEPTNLRQVTAQILEWIYGLTNIQFEITRSRISKTVISKDQINYAIEITTNAVALNKIRHPFALVVDGFNLVITCEVLTPMVNLDFSDDRTPVAEFEIEHMPDMVVRADNGGFSTISVQTKFSQFDGGTTVLTRHVLFRNNLLHSIR